MLHPRNANGTGSRWSALLAAALAGYALGAAHTARLRHQLAAARHAAVHDPLTGLPNRHAALVHLRWRLSARRPTSWAPPSPPSPPPACTSRCHPTVSPPAWAATSS